MPERFIFLKTRDCPDANGRQPLLGEQKYTLTFPLETGEILKLEMGQEGYEHLGQFLLDMMAGTPSYTDEDR